MPVAKFWDGTAWVSLNGLPVYEQPGQPSEPVPQGSVWIDTDAPAPAVYPKLLNVQTICGNREDVRAFTTATDLYIDTTNLLRLQYTPPVDAWWEVSATNGDVVKVDAAYHYCEQKIVLTPADVDGISWAYSIISQYAGVQTYECHNMSRIFKLQAGVAYTAQAHANPQGGSWSYYQGKNYLYMNAKAWAR